MFYIPYSCKIPIGTWGLTQVWEINYKYPCVLGQDSSEKQRWQEKFIYIYNIYMNLYVLYIWIYYLYMNLLQELTRDYGGQSAFCKLDNYENQWCNSDPKCLNLEWSLIKVLESKGMRNWSSDIQWQKMDVPVPEKRVSLLVLCLFVLFQSLLV